MEDGDIRTSGRVAVQYHGVWGTICRDGWNIWNARYRKSIFTQVDTSRCICRLWGEGRRVLPTYHLKDKSEEKFLVLGLGQNVASWPYKTELEWYISGHPI